MRFRWGPSLPSPPTRRFTCRQAQRCRIYRTIWTLIIHQRASFHASLGNPRSLCLLSGRSAKACNMLPGDWERGEAQQDFLITSSRMLNCRRHHVPTTDRCVGYFGGRPPIVPPPAVCGRKGGPASTARTAALLHRHQHGGIHPRHGGPHQALHRSRPLRGCKRCVRPRC